MAQLWGHFIHLGNLTFPAVTSRQRQSALHQKEPRVDISPHCKHVSTSYTLVQCDLALSTFKDSRCLIPHFEEPDQDPDQSTDNFSPNTWLSSFPFRDGLAGSNTLMEGRVERLLTRQTSKTRRWLWRVRHQYVGHFFMRRIHGMARTALLIRIHKRQVWRSLARPTRPSDGRTEDEAEN